MHLISVLSKGLQVPSNHEKSFVYKTNSELKIVRTSNKIKVCKVNCIFKNNAKIEDKELQVSLNLSKT